LNVISVAPNHIQKEIYKPDGVERATSKRWAFVVLNIMNIDFKKWISLVNEPLTIERVGESYFAYGSEKACKYLLLEVGYGVAEFSPMINKWFYSTYIDKLVIS